jgi:hypothetical protein
MDETIRMVMIYPNIVLILNKINSFVVRFVLLLIPELGLPIRGRENLIWQRRVNKRPQQSPLNSCDTASIRCFLFFYFLSRCCCCPLATRIARSHVVR